MKNKTALSHFRVVSVINDCFKVRDSTAAIIVHLTGVHQTATSLTGADDSVQFTVATLQAF